MTHSIYFFFITIPSYVYWDCSNGPNVVYKYEFTHTCLHEIVLWTFLLFKFWYYFGLKNLKISLTPGLNIKRKFSWINLCLLVSSILIGWKFLSSQSDCLIQYGYHKYSLHFFLIGLGPDSLWLILNVILRHFCAQMWVTAAESCLSKRLFNYCLIAFNAGRDEQTFLMPFRVS